MNGPERQRGLPPGEHLDATGERKVVYCHHCQNEWWQDDHGIICPECDGEVTEVVEPNHDPRDLSDSGPLRELHDHNPWAGANLDDDPEEADIEEHITRGPNGLITISQTIRSSPIRRPSRTRPEPSRRRSSNPFTSNRDADRDDPFQGPFQNMMRGLMESSENGTPTPRGGRHEDHFDGLPWHRNRSNSGRGYTFTTDGHNVMGSRVTYTSGRFGGPRTVMGGAEPPINELSALLSTLLGGPLGEEHTHPGMPPRTAGPNFPALLAALMNPANAASGDAVYTQEALDRVISQLMEAHPTSSSAPGPAAPSSISSLPKRNLTDKDLEGNKKVVGKNGVEEMKGECSVCMDDVGVGEEMVFLPCKHWFHEACAAAWLSEHDSCPICRKSISPEGNSNSNNNGPNGSGSGNGSGIRGGGPFRRASGSMGSFGANWGSNNPFNNPASSSSSGPGNGWGPSRPSSSIFTSAGRRMRRDERQRQENEAERLAEQSVNEMTGNAYYAHLVERERRMREAEQAGSGNDGHSRWTSASTNQSSNNTSDESSRGGGGGGIFGLGGRRGEERTTSSTSRRYSTIGRAAPQRRESDRDRSRTRSTSPPDRPMPGAFSPTPPRRDSARSSRSGSGSGSGSSGASGGGSGGVMSWVRDRFPGGSRRGDAN